jgi:hypothetical protein
MGLLMCKEELSNFLGGSDGDDDIGPAANIMGLSMKRTKIKV